MRGYMRVAKMPHLSWDNQRKRAVYQRRYPREVQPLTGVWFRHKYPASLNLADAGRLSHIQTAEYAARVAEATTRLGLPEGRLEIIRQKWAAYGEELRQWGESLAQLKQIADEKTKQVQFHKLARELGVAIPARTVQVVDTETLVQAWQARRTNEGSPPRPRAVTNKRNKLSAMLQRVGKAHLGEVTEGDLKTYKGHLEQKGAAMGQPSLANDHLKEILPLFELAADIGLITTNPAEKIKAPQRERGKRPPFSDAEARTILEAARESADPIVRWSNWLAAFSGTINSEILEANASEFYQLQDGQFVFDMRGRALKTGFRPRIVPLHPSIIREGFPAYLATRAGKILFDGELRAKSQRLNRFLDQIRITKTFYSWRHRVIHQLDHHVKIAPSLSRYIAGHSAKDIHEKFYNHHELPEEFGEIIVAINALVDPIL
jgi:hypothetical protein